MARASGVGTPLPTYVAGRPPPQGVRQQTKRFGRTNHFYPKKSLSAATTKRLASSVPTVMRSAFGSL